MMEPSNSTTYDGRPVFFRTARMHSPSSTGGVQIWGGLGRIAGVGAWQCDGGVLFATACCPIWPEMKPMAMKYSMSSALIALRPPGEGLR